MTASVEAIRRRIQEIEEELEWIRAVRESIWADPAEAEYLAQLDRRERQWQEELARLRKQLRELGG